MKLLLTLLLTLPLIILTQQSFAQNFYFDGKILRGDVNNDTVVNITDVVYLGDWLFSGGPAPVFNFDPSDVNDDGGLNITDFDNLNFYLFGGGSMPAHPFPSPGCDDTPDNVDTCSSPPFSPHFTVAPTNATVTSGVVGTPWDSVSSIGAVNGDLGKVFLLAKNVQQNDCIHSDTGVGWTIKWDMGADPTGVTRKSTKWCQSFETVLDLSFILDVADACSCVQSFGPNPSSCNKLRITGGRPVFRFVSTEAEEGEVFVPGSPEPFLSHTNRYGHYDIDCTSAPGALIVNCDNPTAFGAPPWELKNPNFPMSARFDLGPLLGDECDRWYIDEIIIENLKFKWEKNSMHDLSWDKNNPATNFGEIIYADLSAPTPYSIDLKDVQHEFHSD